MDTLVKNLRAVLKPEQVISDPEELLVFECDGLTHYRHRPRAVVFPQSTEEASEVMRLLACERVAVVPRGAGTGLSGGALAVGGGVCIELARMRRMLKIDVENGLAVVEAGVVNAQVSRAVARYGLHYVPDPSSQGSCTIGGNIAENAGGIHCLKYGTTTDHVLGARVVLYGGRVLNLGGAGAQHPGYDLLGVFVGSEGTFGIATEATLRLTPVAPSVRTLLADFTDIDDASRAVSAIIAAGIIPAGLEMVDGATIRAVEASVFAAGMPTDAAGALLVELDGIEAGIDEEVARIRGICAANGARTVRLAADELERKKLWAARKGAFGAMGRISPDILIQDAVVPRSRLPEVLAAIYRIGAEQRLRVANVFHAGDGNLHPLICFDSRDAGEVARVKLAGREIMETCVRAGGTITGEHGVGLDKSEYLPLVFDDDSLGAMLRVRAAFDPTGLCNPGKIIPALKGCGEGRAVAEVRRAAAGDGNRGAREEEVKQETDKESEGRKSLTAEMLLNEPSQPTPSSVSQTTSAPVSHTYSTGAVSQTPSTPASHPAASALTCVSTFNAERACSLLAGVVGVEHASTEGGANRTDGDATCVDASMFAVVAPGSFEEACEVLKVAAREGWKVVPAGATTGFDAGNPLRGGHIVVKTTRMARMVAHEPADLVATVEAGLTLADFNREVGRARQWLPLDPPGWGDTTLGGVAARGARGAQAHGYGTPRSYVLGVRVALADGRVIRAGGRVVKNVAGYDLCKLFVGSRGTLGLILELTFKLRPRPAREATLAATSADLPRLLEAARSLVASQLFPVAVEIVSPRTADASALPRQGGEFLLLARFAGTEGAVAFQVARARELARAHGKLSAVEVLNEDGPIWSGLAAARARDGQNLVWSASVLPSELGAMLERLREERSDEAAWHAGAGDGRLRIFETAARDDAATVASLRRLREAARRAGGSLVVERAPDALMREFDAWGLSDSEAFLMRRVKSQLDPSDTFSPGRF
ncbi:MAG TPA: FAD-linked oxidase C-terminal domain-containing protein [Pyrinomonadaceae bacterium]|nr:FAD-linked oxidase C-terminal domain-containing protein [Pyrinomonadaceae bacterium]